MGPNTGIYGILPCFRPFSTLFCVKSVNLADFSQIKARSAYLAGGCPDVSFYQFYAKSAKIPIYPCQSRVSVPEKCRNVPRISDFRHISGIKRRVSPAESRVPARHLI